ncbi:uncharacterized protein LOC133927484 [Phragmites australis]|uniref:uncharacterized protein LOC133927484 n=1 Tax=Phragmites australis TaxID=29695 RepID=UPI002D785A7B|nr:uncharacterized protein LOC133927484 [Phragmites australis]
MAAAPMLLLRANPAAAIPVPISTVAYSWSWPTLPSSSTSTAARCSVGSSAKLFAVQFQEPLRSYSDPWGGRKEIGRASPASNAIIFRRGYATERQKGLLLVEKLDYLQPKLLQSIFFGLSKPLKKPGQWLNEALKRSTGKQGFQIWIDKLKLWIKEQTYADNSLLLIENSSWDKLRSDQLPYADVPIWIAAQRTVSRYEGILSPVGPRGRLLRRLLTWSGLIPSLPEATVKPDVETKHLEGYVRANFLPRITLANMWEPASRESCNNNVWEIVKTSFVFYLGSLLFRCCRLLVPACLASRRQGVLLASYVEICGPKPGPYERTCGETNVPEYECIRIDKLVNIYG